MLRYNQFAEVLSGFDYIGLILNRHGRRHILLCGDLFEADPIRPSCL